MEIKRTVLAPFGGPREESGANGSLWSMGGGIIGSPEPTGETFTLGNGFSSSIFTVRNSSDAGYFTLNNPNSRITSIRDTLPGTYDTTDWSASLFYEESLVGTFPIVKSFGNSASFQPSAFVSLSWMSPLYNTASGYINMPYQITSITFDTNAKTVEITIVDPAPIVSPTANWLTWFSSRFIFPSTIYPEPETEWADIISNPTAYSLVIEGGPEAGTYPIGYASQLGPTAPGVIALSLASSSSEGLDIPDRLIGLEGAEMSYFVGNGWTPTAGTASIVLA